MGFIEKKCEGIMEGSIVNKGEKWMASTGGNESCGIGFMSD